MSMASVCLPSDALSQHLLSYLGFSYLGRGYLFTASPAKRSRCSLPWTRGISSPPPLLTSNVKQLLSALLRPRSHHSLDVGLLLSAAAPDLGLWGSSSLRCLCAAAAAGACGLSDSGGVGDALSPAQEGGPGEVGGAPSHLVLTLF